MMIRKLTARFVETIKVGQARKDFPDAGVPGLQLRVTSQCKKTWALRYRRASDGRRRRHTLGCYPTLSLDEARARARQELVAIVQGADPAAETQARKEAETFAELANDWMERHGKPNISPRALRDNSSMLNRHILPAIGTMKACEIRKRDIIRLLDTVAAKPDGRLRQRRNVCEGRRLTHRPNRVFELVRAIFRWAVGRDLLQTDPTYGLSPPIKKIRPRERALSPEEICCLWRALDNAPSVRPMKRQEGDFPMTRATALTLKLALVTGQRIGEVSGIVLDELDLNATAPMWTIPGERAKSGRSNRVPLSPIAVHLIAKAQQLAGESPWLFPSPLGAGPIDSHAPTKAWARARTAIGLADVRVHDLRRTVATRMAEMGISPHTISLVLNHVSVHQASITAKVYVQYSYDREKRVALNAWGTRLEQIVTNTAPDNIVPLRSTVTPNL